MKIEGQDFVTVLAAALALFGLVGTVVTSLSSTDIEENGKKRLTMPGAIALSIAIICGIGSIASEFIKRQIEINKEHAEMVEVAGEKLIRERDAQFQNEVRAWDARAEATSETIKKNTEAALKKQSDLFSRMISGFEETERRIAQNNREIDLSRERMMNPIGKAGYGFLFRADCSGIAVSLYCGLTEQDTDIEAAKKALGLDEIITWMKDPRHGIRFSVCIIRDKIIAAKFLGQTDFRLCERSNAFVANFGTTANDPESKRPYLQYLADRRALASEQTIFLSLGRYDHDAPDSGSHGLDSMLDLRGAHIFVAPDAKGQFEHLSLTQLSIYSENHVVIFTSACKPVNLNVFTIRYSGSAASYDCVISPNAPLNRDITAEFRTNR